MTTSAAAGVRCALCGIPPAGPASRKIFGGEALVFCCHGCLHVYGLLREGGDLQPGMDPRQTELFQRAQEAGLVGGGHAAALPTREVPETAVLALGVEGMWSPSCGWMIERVICRERGVLSVDVLYPMNEVRICYSPRLLDSGRIPQRIERLGYLTFPAGRRPGGNEAGRRNVRARLWVAAGMWLIVEMLCTKELFPAAAVLTALVLGYAGWPVLGAAARGLRARMVRPELLPALAILWAYGFSVAEVAAGTSRHGFDFVCAAVTCLLAGRWLELIVMERPACAVSKLRQLLPPLARVRMNGKERRVRLDLLMPGSTFAVEAGERIPVDGFVTSGCATVNDSGITGCLQAQEITAGAAVIGGSEVLAGTVTVTAAVPGGEGTLPEMIHAVERALASRSNLDRRMERVAAAMIPFVLAGGALVIGGGYLAGELPAAAAIFRVIAVLAIGGPCTLAIAVPMAMAGAVTAAARHGVVLNHADVLDTLRRVDTVVLQKSGGVTTGVYRMLRCAGLREEQVLRRLAPIEVFSVHPLAQAIVERAIERGIPFAPAGEVLQYEGLGISGSVDGEDVFAGNARLALHLAGRIPPILSAVADNWQGSGMSAVYVGWNGQVRAVLCCASEIREHARETVRRLRTAGVRTVVLSGDAAGTAGKVAAMIGATGFEADVLPEAKARFLRRLCAAGGCVAMVGDGVEDARAMAHATVGIAIGGGPGHAGSPAAVCLMAPSLRRVGDLFSLAKRTARSVRWSLAWSCGMSGAGAVLAMAGLIPPAGAAVGALASTALVCGHALRLSNWKPEH